MTRPEIWLRVAAAGLYCEPGDFYIDPARAVDRAVITHGHGDHARPGHQRVPATASTIAIRVARMGDDAIGQTRAAAYGENVQIGDVCLRMLPAGHILGSAQVVMEYGGCRVIVSGDYKRRPDPTCAVFEPMKCDLFVTEATFGLPVFRHPDDGAEIGKLLESVRLFPDRSHVVGVYALGKCQRVIKLLRCAGYEAPIYLHGALQPLCDPYGTQGVDLGRLQPASANAKAELVGQIVLAVPSALADRWARRLADPVTAMASGWMRVRTRARQAGIELPLVISDHADWDELTRTIRDVQAPELWVTHGREEALIHYAASQGVRARALSLVGREEEGQ